MRDADRPLSPGLYFVATPIGAARDITLRTLDILSEAEILAAEDTRSLRHLMEIHGIVVGERPLIAYHDHNAPRTRPRLLAALAEGRSIAYAAEAGTPLVADPGYRLGQEAIAAGHAVFAAPGPSAVLAALVVSGLPSDRFLFAGFPPPADAARRRFLTDLAGVDATLILYESPRRTPALLAVLAEIFGPDRRAALCRELTKRHEEIRRASLSELAQDAQGETLRGEVVLVIDRGAPAEVDEATLEEALDQALDRQSLKQAVAAVSARMNLPRRRVYQAALRIRGSR